MKWKDCKAKLKDSTHEARVLAFLRSERFKDRSVLDIRSVRKQLSLERYREMYKDFKMGEGQIDDGLPLPWL